MARLSENTRIVLECMYSEFASGDPYDGPLNCGLSVSEITTALSNIRQLCEPPKRRRKRVKK